MSFVKKNWIMLAIAAGVVYYVYSKSSSTTAS